MEPEAASPAGTEAAGRARVFFALWPDAALARDLHRLGGDLAQVCGGRRMRADTLHVTLAFIGEVARDRLAALEAAADAVPVEACRIAIDRVGCWPHNGIVWAGCSETPPVLRDLAAGLGARLADAGFRLERRPFTPHVTLLRRAHCASPLQCPTSLMWHAREFVLVESLRDAAGARYRVLRRWSAPRGAQP